MLLFAVTTIILLFVVSGLWMSVVGLRASVHALEEKLESVSVVHTDEALEEPRDGL